jgi:hypothetical protein
MPILRTYGDASFLGSATFMAGQQTGRANRLAQQRAIDAQFVNERLRARENIVAMETAANLSRDRGGGGYQSPRNQAEGTINDFAAQRSAVREKRAFDDMQVQEEQRKQQGVLSALDAAYQGREKDFTYHYARRRLEEGQTIPDRMLSGLGVASASPAEADARDQADMDGQVDTVQPKTAHERGVRHALTQGRPSDIAPFLDQRDTRSINLQGGARPLTQDALEARAQLHGFADSQTDAAVLEEVIKSLGASKVSEEALAPLRNRINQLQKEDIELKAPVAFEQAVGLFQTQLQAAQTKEGRTLGTSERRGLLARTLEQTAKSYGLTIEQMSQFVRANDERRREAEMLVQRAENAIVQARAAVPLGGPANAPGQPQPQGQPQGQPQQGQPATDPQRQRRPTFGRGNQE